MTWCPIKLSKSDFLKGFSSLKKSSDWLDVWPFWFTLKQWILWIFFQFLAQTLAQTLALTYDRFQKNNYKKPSAVLRFMGLVKRLKSVNSQHAERFYWNYRTLIAIFSPHHGQKFIIIPLRRQEEILKNGTNWRICWFPRNFYKLRSSKKTQKNLQDILDFSK